MWSRHAVARLQAGIGYFTINHALLGPDLVRAIQHEHGFVAVDLHRDVASSYIQAYTQTARFGWDARKSDRNLRARGFDFEFATQVFDGPTLERPDTRCDYGERRVVAIGRADGITLTLVYTERAEAGELIRRIMSARVSSRSERQAYEQAVQGRS